MTTTPTNSAKPPFGTDRAGTFSRTFSRIGYWSALACAVGAFGYVLASVINVVTAPSALGWVSYEEFMRSYNPVPTFLQFTPVFLVALVYPLLVLAIYGTASDERRPYALLALVFAGIYSAVLGSAYWIQLTVVPWNVARGGAEGLASWVVWNPTGFFWGFESFGYFMMGLFALFTAFAYDANTLSRRTRRGLIAMAPLGLGFMINMAVAWPEEAAGLDVLSNVSAVALAFAWAILFGLVSFGGLARFFGRARVKFTG